LLEKETLCSFLDSLKYLLTLRDNDSGGIGWEEAATPGVKVDTVRSKIKRVGKYCCLK